MFAGWGSWVARFRWPVLAVALVAVISAGVWGLGVFGELTEGGYTDPNSESTQATEAIQDAFGAPGGDLVVIYTPTKGKIDDAALTKRIKASLAALPKSAVTASTSYWAQKSAQYAAEDKSSAVAVITLAGDDDAGKLDAYRAVDDKFAVEGARVQLSGATVLADASSSRSTEDLGTAELISLPITLVLLVFLFGSLVAASLPVLVGGAAVAGSLGILHAIASQHEVNSFAVNVASLLGLGMAIDYGLFMVGRFREERAEGRTPAEAVARTVGTAGRTVVFSATLLMIALAGLLLFPQGFLKSLAYGGLAAVFLAALLSLTLLPALLAVLGPAVDRLPVRLPRRSGAGPAGSGWDRLAGFVLRRPLLVAVPILAGLLLLASPVSGVHFAESDERILPANDPARQAIETIKADYPQFTGDGVQIVLRNAQDSAGFAVALRQLPGIEQITPARRNSGVTVFTATLKAKDAFSDQARDVVDAIRALPVPPGAQLLVGGTTARNVDSLQATADRLPLMIGMLVGATLLLMFLAFGSVLLPIKAVLMSALSLCATFGALVWIFQDGHLAGLLDVTPAPLEVGIVVLMAAVVFGLSTDYEVFLLSRMVEARTRGATTGEAVATGLARTGRVISAAALLLIVVTGAFALSAVTTMRFVGVGMIIALVLDATVVRMLLVPAVLRLLGDAAWWAPGPLRRLQQRAGLSEYAGERATGSASARHAASEDTEVLAALAGYRRLDPDAPFALPAAPERRPAWQLPSAAHALPSDATQMLPRFEDTEVLSLPPAPTPTAAEVAAVEFRPLRPASETPDEPGLAEAELVEAELVEAELVLDGPAAPVETRASGEAEPEVADAELIEEPDEVVTATATVPEPGFTEIPEPADWTVPEPAAWAVAEPAVETADWAVAEPAMETADWAISEPAMETADWAVSDFPGDDEFAPPFRAAEPEPGPGRVLPVDLSEWLPAVPGYEAPAADWTRSDDSYFFAPARGADSGPLALPAGVGFLGDTWQPAGTHDTPEFSTPPAGPDAGNGTAPEPAAGDPYVPVAATRSEPGGRTADLTDFGPTVDLIARLGLPRRPAAAPASPAAAPASPTHAFPAAPASPTHAFPAAPASPTHAFPAAPASPAAFPAADHQPPGWHATNTGGRPADLGGYAQDRRPADLGGNPATRPARWDDQTPPRRPANPFGDRPPARRPLAHWPEMEQPATIQPPPVPPTVFRPDDFRAAATPREPMSYEPVPYESMPYESMPYESMPYEPQPPAVRRPADLADHLRESRPADLSQYTAGPPRIPRTRPPADDHPAPADDHPTPARRPATLADHLSARQAGDEDGPTRDLSDHLEPEG